MCVEEEKDTKQVVQRWFLITQDIFMLLSSA
jgi:hypothetical protein